MQPRTHQALILGATAFLGAAAVIGKLLDLWRWHVDSEPIESVVIDTQTNGSAWSGTSQTR